MRYLFSLSAVALAVLVSAGAGASAQEPAGSADADRAPHFLLASASGHERVRVDVALTPSLRRRISVDLESVTLNDALSEISERGNLRLLYSRDVVPLDAVVRLKAENITVAGALSEVLLDAGVDVLMSPDGRAALVKRAPAAALAAGSIAGRVTDAKTQAALVGATVVVEGTSRSATTGNDGRYRIADVAPGTYTVRARYIGYAPGSTSVTVSAEQEATADFGLEKSAQRLDEVVTTGTLVPTEVKALPTPITVITADELQAQHVKKTDQFFRQSVPSAVAWEDATDPEATEMSVRGAATVTGLASMKVYLDGVEISNRLFAAIDPNSIDRIEVVRGPQAATLYGSEALDGVMQVFTKRGAEGAVAPQVDAQVAGGIVQSPYAPFGGGNAIRQEYAASVRGGGPRMSYNLGGGYTHVGDWLPHTTQSLPSAYGGAHLDQGPLTVDLSARYYVQHQETEWNPALAQTGFPGVSKPFFDPENNQEQTYGARVAYAPTSWWRHNLTVGFDRFLIDIPQSQPRLTTPDDTLLSVYNLNQSKTSIAYNTSVLVPLGSSVSATITAGLDHYVFRSDEYFVSGTLNTTGSIQTVPDQSFQSVTRNVTTNTGYFAQAQLGIVDAVFVTGGFRAEQNSNFGADLGTPVSPRLGLSFVRQVNGATLKLRGSYGEATRAPDPSKKDGSAGTTSVRLANPRLAPERQNGWDTGVDLVFGRRGSLAATYYDQTARDAIELVELDAGAVPRIFQFQNVGRVKNTGFEFEGALNAGPFGLKAQYAIARSRPEELGPSYTGDLRVGEQVIGFPEHTGGASLTVTPVGGTTISAGLTYVGSWTHYDYFAEYRCFGGTGPCSASTRGYLISYPGFVKANFAVDQQLGPGIFGFISVYNLTNSTAFELANYVPVTGRITMVGARVTR